MTDFPAIMSAPMIRAILREIEHPGTGKTMTRRMAWTYHDSDTVGPSPESHDGLRATVWQRVKPGDRLWARETCLNSTSGGTWKSRWLREADGSPCSTFSTRERPGRRAGMHMPRKDSRFTLIVTVTKIERLQEISDEDAKAEGIELPPTMSALDHGAYRHCFMTLWNTLHGKGSADFTPWDANPDVVAIRFVPRLSNIDALPKAEAA